ncbi:diguanylate cyclase [Vibrio ponticus]|nr:diguanylate cyclase [Vibrio ponticus]
MEKLAGHFRQSYSLINSYALTISRSDIVQQYLNVPDNPVVEMKMLANLQGSIASFESISNDSIGIAVLDNQFTPRFYLDNTYDPLSKIDNQVLKYIQRTFTQVSPQQHIGFSRDQQGRSLLIYYQVINPTAWGTSYNAETQSPSFFLVYLTLEEFDQLKQQIEFDNQSSIFFTSESVTKTGLMISTQLQSDLYANLDPAEYLLADKLQSIQHKLLVFFIASSVVTLLILIVLLYRHVISPLVRLDRQLHEVEQQKRDNIDKFTNDDEIGRLSERFYSMYLELQSAYQKAKALAENDHLTGLANRYQFQNHASMQLESSTSDKHAWILFIDLDNFKYVNDKYGHDRGDKLLSDFAKHIQCVCNHWQHSSPIHSLAARLSGDEFAIYIETQIHQFDIDGFAQDFFKPLVEPALNWEEHLPITASVGIARYPCDGDNLETLLTNADTAMYQAKKAGKNQLSYYSSELDQEIRRRTQIERELRSGRFNQEFSLLYQPYFNQGGNKVVGVEALLRWHSEKLGFVSPNEFIPISEQTGLFGLIDRWVIEQTFRDFSTIQSNFTDPIQVSINLSSAELDSKQLASFIREKSMQYHVEPNLIDFEITETFATDSQGFPLLHELAMMGFKLAIDDFGSGYTSISQLVKYPVQKIKLDREFLAALIKTNNRRVVKPIVELCHSQAMLVTAEGIETEDMHQWLAENQCDYMQGYYLSRPIELQQLAEFATTTQDENHVDADRYRSLA